MVDRSIDDDDQSSMANDIRWRLVIDTDGIYSMIDNRPIDDDGRLVHDDDRASNMLVG